MLNRDRSSEGQVKFFNDPAICVIFWELWIGNIAKMSWHFISHNNEISCFLGVISSIWCPKHPVRTMRILEDLAWIFRVRRDKMLSCRMQARISSRFPGKITCYHRQLAARLRSITVRASLFGTQRGGCIFPLTCDYSKMCQSRCRFLKVYVYCVPCSWHIFVILSRSTAVSSSDIFFIGRTTCYSGYSIAEIPLHKSSRCRVKEKNTRALSMLIYGRSKLWSPTCIVIELLKLMTTHPDQAKNAATSRINNPSRVAKIIVSSSEMISVGIVIRVSQQNSQTNDVIDGMEGVHCGYQMSNTVESDIVYKNATALGFYLNAFTLQVPTVLRFIYIVGYQVKYSMLIIRLTHWIDDELEKQGPGKSYTTTIRCILSMGKHTWDELSLRETLATVVVECKNTNNIVWLTRASSITGWSAHKNNYQ